MVICTFCNKARSFRSNRDLIDAGWKALHLRFIGGKLEPGMNVKELDLVSCTSDKCKRSLRERYLSLSDVLA